MEIKKILFVTDFSEGSSHALPYAVDLAKKYGAKLYLMHVVYDVAKVTGWHVPHAPLDEVYRDIEAGSRTELEKVFIDEMRGFKDVERVIVRGTPQEEITRFASENRVDMIVIGTHGRKGLDRMIFGSTAEQIIRNAPCPVLSVKLVRQED